MRYQLLFICSIFFHFSCSKAQKQEQSYPLQVGDTYYNPKIDEANFKLCDEIRVLQYYNFGEGLQYKGEKIEIIEHFFSRYKAKNIKNETGFVTIRFLVNCKGLTGRFRIEGMDYNFQKKEFDESIINQLLTLTQQLDGWVIGEYEGKTYDYYQYLTFKIKDGKLIEIMP